MRFCANTLPAIRSFLGTKLPQPDSSRHFSGPYATWDEVRSAAGEFVTSYEYVESRIQSICEGALPAITLSGQLAGLLLPEPPVRVLDYGGSLGHSYFHAQRFAKVRVEVWDVVELEATARYGAKKFKDHPHLRFHSSVEAPEISF